MEVYTYPLRVVDECSTARRGEPETGEIGERQSGRFGKNGKYHFEKAINCPVRFFIGKSVQ